MKKETKQIGLNVFIVALSILTIIIVKVIYYNSWNAPDVYFNTDLAFLCASSIAGMVANREIENYTKSLKNKRMTIFSICFCCLCVIVYGYGMIYPLTLGYHYFVAIIFGLFLLLYWQGGKGLLENVRTGNEDITFTYVDKGI